MNSHASMHIVSQSFLPAVAGQRNVQPPWRCPRAFIVPQRGSQNRMSLMTSATHKGWKLGAGYRDRQWHFDPVACWKEIAPHSPSLLPSLSTSLPPAFLLPSSRKEDQIQSSSRLIVFKGLLHLDEGIPAVCPLCSLFAQRATCWHHLGVF